TLSLHDALPISIGVGAEGRAEQVAWAAIRIGVGDGKDGYAGIALGDGEGEPVVALRRGELEIKIGGDGGHVARRNEPDAPDLVGIGGGHFIDGPLGLAGRRADNRRLGHCRQGEKAERGSGQQPCHCSNSSRSGSEVENLSIKPVNPVCAATSLPWGMKVRYVSSVRGRLGGGPQTVVTSTAGSTA